MQKKLKGIIYTSVFMFCDFAIAGQLIVNSASSYPYKNLIERTNIVKIFYTIKGEGLICRVEVTLDKMKWISVDKIMSKNVFEKGDLTKCLSRESAEQILFQSYLQFGLGL